MEKEIIYKKDLTFDLFCIIMNIVHKYLRKNNLSVKGGMQMRFFVLILCLLSSFIVLGDKALVAKIRIGTYDSRAIAIAYCNSTFIRDYMRDLLTRYNTAKTAGDKKEISKVEAEIKGHQKRLHKQGFSTASVDDLLQHIKECLPDIRKKAGVDIILSKWDKKSLAKYKTAPTKDVTMLLVKAFKPDARTLKIVKQIQTKEPIPLKRAESIKD